MCVPSLVVSSSALVPSSRRWTLVTLLPCLLLATVSKFVFCVGIWVVNFEQLEHKLDNRQNLALNPEPQPPIENTQKHKLGFITRQNPNFCSEIKKKLNQYFR